MGEIILADGNCFVCKAFTSTYCDHCQYYVCSDHSHSVSIEPTPKTFLMCNGCTGKKAVNPNQLWTHSSSF